jgi:hypothetical protein
MIFQGAVEEVSDRSSVKICANKAVQTISRMSGHRDSTRPTSILTSRECYEFVVASREAMKKLTDSVLNSIDYSIPSRFERPGEVHPLLTSFSSFTTPSEGLRWCLFNEGLYPCCDGRSRSKGPRLLKPSDVGKSERYVLPATLWSKNGNNNMDLLSYRRGC